MILTRQSSCRSPFERGHMSAMRSIVLVVARARNGVIGAEGAMPWHLPGDLRRFKAITVGKPVVMGRKTFESIGRPLPGRHNIVLTRDAAWRAEGVSIAANLAEAIAAAGMEPRTFGEIMIIGGGAIYAQALPLAERVELTEIDLAPEGDTFFPQLAADQWSEVARLHQPAEAGRPAHDFVTLVRKRD